MRRKYQNIQRNSTTRLILLNKQINYLLIRVAAFSLPLHVKSNAHIVVKKKEKEEFVQENHLSHLKKNARKEDLIVKNQEKVKEAQNLKKHVHQRNQVVHQKRKLAVHQRNQVVLQKRNLAVHLRSQVVHQKRKLALHQKNLALFLKRNQVQNQRNLQKDQKLIAQRNQNVIKNLKVLKNQVQRALRNGKKAQKAVKNQKEVQKVLKKM